MDIPPVKIPPFRLFAFSPYEDSALSSYGGQWKLLISVVPNVDKRSRAKATTTIENSKYVN